jgi:hypothetical protein
MMLFKFKNGKVYTENIEYSVSYHCNLHCANCSHLSPHSTKKFPSHESFCNDLNRLSKVLHAKHIRLLGGEPLLNPEISKFIKSAKDSGIADIICVSTNGLLLHMMSDDFWNYVDLVTITTYPGHEPKEQFIQIFKERALESDTTLYFYPKSLFRTTVVTEPHPRDWITNFIFKTCENAHINGPMLHEGKLYRCWMPPFLPDYLTKLGRADYNPKSDAFDIYTTQNIYHGLEDFLTSQRTTDCCRFCLGYAGKMQEHHQLERKYILHPNLQNIKRKTSLDTRLFLKNCSRYYYRRFLEHLTGNQYW